ncbi:hypothetical protein K505DRAFT_7392 [Melanomma pulvis-pyrius CBS 109.77]|uniref:Uncharacterized protein n=1 Tax=Melanomma pulvis-pyrius CBS 109.77 TaxID=1314802 RepID=A0A6A6XUX3_9PLEO|nr:hypothetical protein K505DRAFT_7392 [Melanomma pulvis-pyrius CBS 109.77]
MAFWNKGERFPSSFFFSFSALPSQIFLGPPNLVRLLVSSGVGSAALYANAVDVWSRAVFCVCRSVLDRFADCAMRLLTFPFSPLRRMNGV